MVEPELLCRKHLMGEHVEMHMLAGSVSKQKTLTGFITKGLVELDRIQHRHDEIASEVEFRGYNHKSPLDQPDTSCYDDLGAVSWADSIHELHRRCPDCAKRIEGVY